MASAIDTQNKCERRSAFGFLRLLFASLVIVSHAPELVDGNRSRDPLTLAFGTISVGELAVDCFFIISGYLIVGSYIQSPQAIAYLRKRIARIYPAFIVASVVSLSVVAPLAGADMQWLSHNLMFSFLRTALLQPPDVPHSFIGQKHPDINGAMWTIAYEFRCYLLVLLIARIGLLRRPAMIFASALLLFLVFDCLPVNFCTYVDGQIPYSKYWLGESHYTLRFTPMFLMGAVFYLERQRMRFFGRAVVAAMLLLAVCMFFKALAEPAVAIFGAYIIFATASWGASRGIGKSMTTPIYPTAFTYTHGRLPNSSFGITQH